MIPRIQLAFLPILLLGMNLTMTDAELPGTIKDSSSSSSLSSSQLSSSSLLFTQTLSSLKHLSMSTSFNSIYSTTTSTTFSTLSSLQPEPSAPIQETSSLSLLNSATRISSKIYENKSTIDTNVTVQIGNHAYLPCNVKSLSGKPVSWVRVRDGHILTVDLTLFIADERFQAIYHDGKQKWSLQIKYSQPHDMGLYECQVSSEPKKSSRVFLNIVVPKTELIGDHNRFVKAGSKVALHCIVLGSIDPPSFIIWYKGNQQIVQDNKRGWYMQIDREIFGNNSDQQNTIGSLIIPSVTKNDSGNYTCSPSNSASVTVDLHVLNGEYSASAIMSSSVRFMQNNNISKFMILVVLFAVLIIT